MYPTVFLIYFISSAVILLAYLALTFQFSLPYNSWKGQCIVQFYSCLLLSFLWSKHVINHACYFQMITQLALNVHLFFIIILDCDKSDVSR
jgi:hypothetical protein